MIFTIYLIHIVLHCIRICISHDLFHFLDLYQFQHILCVCFVLVLFFYITLVSRDSVSNYLDLFFLQVTCSQDILLILFSSLFSQPKMPTKYNQIILTYTIPFWCKSQYEHNAKWLSSCMGQLVILGTGILQASRVISRPQPIFIYVFIYFKYRYRFSCIIRYIVLIIPCFGIGLAYFFQNSSLTYVQGFTSFKKSSHVLFYCCFGIFLALGIWGYISRVDHDRCHYDLKFWVVTHVET